MDQARSFTIGRLAREAGVGVETVRYYERLGLVRRPERPLRGQRSYPAETAARIAFVKRLQSSGFSLGEIAQILEFEGRPERICAETGVIARKLVLRLRKQIEELQSIERRLARDFEICREGGGGSCCPVAKGISDSGRGSEARAANVMKARNGNTGKSRTESARLERGTKGRPT